MAFSIGDDSPEYKAIKEELMRHDLISADTISRCLLTHGESETIRIMSALITAAYQHGLSVAIERKKPL